MRAAFEKARAPETLLFTDLPVALGLPPLSADDSALVSADVESFFAALNDVLRTWAAAFGQTVVSARDGLLKDCGLPAGEAGWLLFRQEAAALLEQGAMLPDTLKTLLLRANLPAETTEASVDTVLAHLAGRPPRTWSDADAAQCRVHSRAVGEAFRAAVADSARFDTPDPYGLVPSERADCAALIGGIKNALPPGASPRVVRAALLALLRDLSPTEETPE